MHTNLFHFQVTALGKVFTHMCLCNKLLTFTPEAVGFRNNVEKRGGSKACVDV